MKMDLPFVLVEPIPKALVWEPEVDPADIGTEDAPAPPIDLSDATAVVIDVETKGVRTWAAEDEVVGVGVAWKSPSGIGVRYFHVKDTPQHFVEVINQLSAIPEGAHLLAHNVNFDAAWMAEMCRRVGVENPLRWTHCTYGLLKQLASEGWEDQQWGLKWAMKHILGWSNTNEDGVDNWLLSHGYNKQGPTKGELDTPSQHMANLRRWVAKGGSRKLRPDKAEMWRVPANILGRYCALDCLATLDLFDRVLSPLLDRFPEFAEFHTGPWMHVNLLLADQQRDGILVDRDRLLAHGDSLRAAIAAGELEVRTNETLAPIIEEIESVRKEGALSELLAREPKRLKKDGTPSKGWLNWEKSCKDVDFKRWSPGSNTDLRLAIYEGGLLPTEPAADDRMFILHGVNGPVELERTESGLLPVDSEVLSQAPKEWAEPLGRYLDAKKELSIVESYLELLHQKEDGTWRLHAGWTVPGTLTGRLGGREPNLQAIPKSLDFLDCFIPDPDTVWLESDWAALEPHVLAEVSQDKALLDLYGPDANPNHDRYLYTLAGIDSPQFDVIREHYNMENPTKEGVKAAKTHGKKMRDLGKLLVLSGDYGSGYKTKWRKCLLQGIQISLDEMQKIHYAQLDLHGGVRDYRNSLEREWDRRGGWVLSGLGFPTPVHADKKKDLTNRVVQRTGHDIHVLHVWILSCILQDAGIPFTGIVWDFHDQYIAQVPASLSVPALQLAKDAIQYTNELLGGTVLLKGGPRVVSSMSEAKMEEAYNARLGEK